MQCENVQSSLGVQEIITEEYQKILNMSRSAEREYYKADALLKGEMIDRLVAECEEAVEGKRRAESALEEQGKERGAEEELGAEVKRQAGAIRELEKAIEKARKEASKKDSEIAQRKESAEEKERELGEKEKELEALKSALEGRAAEIAGLHGQVALLGKRIEERDSELEERKRELEKSAKAISENARLIGEKDLRLEAISREAKERERAICELERARRQEAGADRASAEDVCRLKEENAKMRMEGEINKMRIEEKEKTIEILQIAISKLDGVMGRQGLPCAPTPSKHVELESPPASGLRRGAASKKDRPKKEVRGPIMDFKAGKMKYKMEDPEGPKEVQKRGRKEAGKAAPPATASSSPSPSPSPREKENTLAKEKSKGKGKDKDMGAKEVPKKDFSSLFGKAQSKSAVFMGKPEASSFFANLSFSDYDLDG